MTMREQMARAMCVADGIDPDATGYGMGVSMPVGKEFPLWQAQLPKLDAALAVLENPTEAVIEAGKGPGAMCREDPSGAFIDMIKAIREGK